MTIESQLALSYYKEIAEINKAHGIFLVQHRETNKIYLKKVMAVYNKSVFQSLQANPIKNTPFIYELIEDGENLIVIEEYISGMTLQEVIDKHGVLPEAQIIHYMTQLCTIIEELHSRRPAIIHRDIKPSNVMVTPDGTIKLLDLNVAKFSDASKDKDTVLLGTHGYAAPEQYGFGASGIQTDIYSIGILINVLLTGKLSRDCTVSSPLTPIIQKCIKLNPKERYRTVHDLKTAITGICDKSAVNQIAKTNYDFLPPGFRSLNPFHMILGTLGYIIIFWLCSSLEVKDVYGAKLICERIVILLIMLSIVFFSSNYMQIQRFFPLCRNQHLIIRIIGIIIGDFLIFILLLIILLLIESLFFH